jgi:hypothetical protein
LLHFEETTDLRNSATPPFASALSQPLAEGVSSIYGSLAPFGSPAFAMRDALDIAASTAPFVADPVAGWRASGSLWTAQRFALRVPRAWNGRLVVAGCPGQRTEFACDRLFGDALVARGYAYICGNKGNGDGAIALLPGAHVEVEGAALPRFPLPDGRTLIFWQHAPGHTMERWLDETIELTNLAREFVETVCGREPELTYAIGLSNGGYQVRRAIEESDLFAGALTWNAVLWSSRFDTIFALAEAVNAMERGQLQRLVEIGFPPDVAAASGDGSLYRKNLFVYWYVTLWLHAVHLDPETSIAYGDVSDPAAAEAWFARISQWRSDRSPAIARRIERFENTGAIRCKLIELASEFDHLTPPRLHFDPYRAMVEQSGKSAGYRGRTIAGAQHVDSWADDPLYPQMRPGLPDVLDAWDELVTWVEGGRVQSR